jgi:hypothetical protein
MLIIIINTLQVTQRRFGYAYVYYLDEAGALAAVQGTQHGVTVHGVFLSSEISKTLSRQMQQRYSMRSRVATYPVSTPGESGGYYLPSHRVSTSPVGGHSHYVYAMAPAPTATPMQLYGVFAPVDYYGAATPAPGAPHSIRYIDVQR